MEFKSSVIRQYGRSIRQGRTRLRTPMVARAMGIKTSAFRHFLCSPDVRRARERVEKPRIVMPWYAVKESAQSVKLYPSGTRGIVTLTRHQNTQV